MVSICVPLYYCCYDDGDGVGNKAMGNGYGFLDDDVSGINLGDEVGTSYF